MKKLLKIFSVLLLICSSNTFSFAAKKVDYLKTDWSFKGLFGKFDRASLQRGYQVYTEVCASCHSMKYLSYRNLAEKGGPEFPEILVHLFQLNFCNLSISLSDMRHKLLCKLDILFEEKLCQIFQKAL